MMKNKKESWTFSSFKARFDSLKMTLTLLLRNPASAFGFIVVMLYFIVAILDQVAPSILGVSPPMGVMSTNFGNPTPMPPSWINNIYNWTLPFGTTYPGINLFQAMIKAIRIDVAFSVFVVTIGSSIGIFLGLFSAYYGKLFDEIIMRITDMFFSIPYLVLAIAIGFFLGRDLIILSLALIAIWWPIYARVVRGQVLSLKEQTYVEAAKASGVGNIKIMFKHILPNTLAPIFVQFSFDLATIVLVLATLDFIGFIPGNAYLPELGYLASIGYGFVTIGDWWTMAFPGLAILLFALSMNLLGDGLRDAFDPRLRR